MTHLDQDKHSVSVKRNLSLVFLCAGIIFAALVGLFFHYARNDDGRISKIEPAAGEVTLVPERVPPSEVVPYQE